MDCVSLAQRSHQSPAHPPYLRVLHRAQASTFLIAPSIRLIRPVTSNSMVAGSGGDDEDEVYQTIIHPRRGWHGERLTSSQAVEPPDLRASRFGSGFIWVRSDLCPMGVTSRERALAGVMRIAGGIEDSNVSDHREQDHAVFAGRWVVAEATPFHSGDPCRNDCAVRQRWVVARE